MIDVIIPTKNSASTLRQCLQSLKEQHERVHVIVVDAGSTDGTLDIACEFKADIYAEPPSNAKGSHRAVACNEGLRHSTSPIVAFMDSDVTAPVLWSYFLPKYIKGNVAGVTSGTWKRSSTDDELVIRKLVEFGSQSHGRCFNKETEVDSIPGYNSMYLRKAIEEVGGFSEDLGGCEDLELNMRLQRKGYRLLGVPEVPVLHREGQSWDAFQTQMMGYGWSRGRLLVKRHLFSLKHAAPLIIGMAFLFIPLFAHMLSVVITSALLSAWFMGSIFLLGTDVTPKRIAYMMVATFNMEVFWAVGYLVALLGGDFQRRARKKGKVLNNNSKN